MHNLWLTLQYVDYTPETQQDLSCDCCSVFFCEQQKWLKKPLYVNSFYFVRQKSPQGKPQFKIGLQLTREEYSV